MEKKKRIEETQDSIWGKGRGNNILNGGFSVGID